MFEYVVNFYILHGKYYIHKQKFAKCIPKCNLFLIEMESLKKSLKLVKNKKNEILLKFMEKFLIL